MLTARLEIVAKPGARIETIGRRNGAVVVAVRERAVDGRANDAILRAVAAWLGVAPSRVTLIRGAGTRRKLLAVDGIAAAALAERVAQLAG
jgi:uncharacterized protein YggU (UPF0235/DUF167 family)